MATVPSEVLEHVAREFATSPEGLVDPKRVVCGLKDTTTAMRIWNLAKGLFPVGSLRRCHTKHYWAYYSIPPEVVLAEGPTPC